MTFIIENIGFFNEKELIDKAYQWCVENNKYSLNHALVTKEILESNFGYEIEKQNKNGEIVFEQISGEKVFSDNNPKAFAIYKKHGAVVQWNSVKWREPSEKNSKLEWAKEVLTKLAGYAITEDA